MTINLSKAVKGSVVTFRCGGSAVIDYWHGDHFFFVGEDFNQDSGIWYNDGHVHEEGNHPLDIISITPPAFDWKDVRAGMAFVERGKDIVHFIGWHPIEKGPVTTLGKHGSNTWFRDWEKDLTRAPEHDLIAGGE